MLLRFCHFLSLSILSLVLLASPTYASVLYFKPLGGNITPNVTFPVEVHLVANPPESITSVSVYFNYPQDKLDIVSVKPGSSFPLNLGHSFQNGNFAMTRNNANGVSGDVVVATIGFRAKMANTPASLMFVDGIMAEQADHSETLDLAWTKNNVANFNILEGTIRTVVAGGQGAPTESGGDSVNGLTELPVAGLESTTSLALISGLLLILVSGSGIYLANSIKK